MATPGGLGQVNCFKSLMSQTRENVPLYSFASFRLSQTVPRGDGGSSGRKSSLKNSEKSRQDTSRHYTDRQVLNQRERERHDQHRRTGPVSEQPSEFLFLGHVPANDDKDAGQRRQRYKAGQRRGDDH